MFHHDGFAEEKGKLSAFWCRPKCSGSCDLNLDGRPSTTAWTNSMKVLAVCRSGSGEKGGDGVWNDVMSCLLHGARKNIKKKAGKSLGHHWETSKKNHQTCQEIYIYVYVYIEKMLIN